MGSQSCVQYVRWAPRTLPCPVQREPADQCHSDMFYPDLSPAMRWHLHNNQKIQYNMQMFSNQFSDKLSDQYGEA